MEGLSMARYSNKNTFFIVSGDPNRIENINEFLMKNYSNTTVFHAADWFDVKYKVENVRPKVIFVDEFLPRGSGLEIVSKLLKEKANAGIGIVIMSYAGDTNLFLHETKAGRVTYLKEPDNEAAVLEAMEKFAAPNKEEKPAYNIIHLSAGDVLFKEGENTQLVYIVKNGTLRAYAQVIEGGRIDLGDIKSGEFVGEMGHFNHEPRSATVEAVTDVELIEIPMAALDDVIFSKPSWAKALVKTLAQRLKKANKALAG